ncbi:copine-3-like isoform X2 [Tubulanus polymorphus]|uniref:copine-3-like isoform X2 n=1 Tax=Tubulanus polymorphus TaxID=672921 RepID=UPI003DA26375
MVKHSYKFDSHTSGITRYIAVISGQQHLSSTRLILLYISPLTDVYLLVRYYISDTTEMDEIDKLEVYIKCSDIEKAEDTIPVCVIHQRQYGQWKQVWRSEPAINKIKPTFTNVFITEFNPHHDIKLLVTLYSMDPRIIDLDKQHVIGSVEITAHELVSTQSNKTEINRILRIPGFPKPRGWITFLSETYRPNRGRIFCHIGCSNMKREGAAVSRLWKKKVYLEIQRRICDTHHPVYRTELLKSNAPRWKPFEISLSKLTGMSQSTDAFIKFIIYKKNRGNHKEISSSKIRIQDLIQNNEKRTDIYKLKMMKCKKIKEEKDEEENDDETLQITELLFYKCSLERDYSLNDYINCGFNLKQIYAIDFTMSNGDLTNNNSLHHLLPMNEYEKTMRLINGAIGIYDHTQQIHLYGFGAKLPDQKHTSHCFCMNTEPVKGIQGMISAYEFITPQLTFSGPTYFTPVIKHAMKLVQQSEHQRHYYVVTIITDGVLNDLDATLDVLCDACDLPMSVLIVCLGPSDFHYIDQLRSTPDNLLKCAKSKNTAWRPNSHVIVLRNTNFNSPKILNDLMFVISSQFITYMKSKSIFPENYTHNSTTGNGNWVNALTQLQAVPQSKEVLCPVCGSDAVKTFTTVQKFDSSN